MLTLTDRPVLVAVTSAVPGVAPAVSVVTVLPSVPVCPLVTSSAATSVAGVVVRLQATVTPVSAVPCRSRTVAVIRSVWPVRTSGVAALTARPAGMAVSIRKWIGSVRPALRTMRSPVTFTVPDELVRKTSAYPSSRRVPAAPAMTWTRYTWPARQPVQCVSQLTWYCGVARSSVIAGVVVVVKTATAGVAPVLEPPQSTS